MALHRRRDRRERPTTFEDRPRSSAATLILLTVSGVLLVTAAATAIFGNGFSDATPHERLLGMLDRVAEAQAEHRRTTGRFTTSEPPLGLQTPPDVELLVIRASATEWEAVARSDEHALSCSLAGAWESGRAIRDQPVCYREAR